MPTLHEAVSELIRLHGVQAVDAEVRRALGERRRKANRAVAERLREIDRLLQQGMSRSAIAEAQGITYLYAGTLIGDLNAYKRQGWWDDERGEVVIPRRTSPPR